MTDAARKARRPIVKQSAGCTQPYLTNIIVVKCLIGHFSRKTLSKSEKPPNLSKVSGMIKVLVGVSHADKVSVSYIQHQCFV